MPNFRPVGADPSTGELPPQVEGRILDRANHQGTQSLDTTTDSATRAAVTPAAKTKLDGIASQATKNATDAALRDRATHTGSQDSTTINDFAEAVQDVVGAMLVSGGSLTIAYDDTTGRVTITGAASGNEAEVIRDTIGMAMSGINGVTVTVDDPGDTIVLGISGLTISQVTNLQSTLNAKADLVAGKVPTTQLPPQVFSTAVQVADQAAMLALDDSTVQRGDFAIRQDGAGTFQLLGDGVPSTLSNWVLHSAPAPTYAQVAPLALPKWRPNTAYTAGVLVLNPSGQIVSALADFTSGTTYSSANWGPVTAPATLVTVLAADAAPVNNSVALVNSGLSVNLEANSVYRLEAEFFYDASTVGDMRFRWSVPNGVTMTWAHFGLNSATTSGTNTTSYFTGTSSTIVIVGGAGVGSIIAVRPSGIVRTGATAGAFGMQYGQSTADPTDLTLRANSSLRMTKIG